MKISHSLYPFAGLLLVGTLVGSATAAAPVAGGTTTLNVNVTESTRLAMGWSVKKTLLGKTIYNDAGEQVGDVEDLIISPDRDVSYVIVGAGGFVGIGRHDVAIPVRQIHDEAGKLVMPGATKDMIKSMPEFAYIDDAAMRDDFIASANREITRGKDTIASLEKKVGAAAADAKARLGRDITALRSDVKSAEASLADMKQATAMRWKEFESDVNSATARLRKSIDRATG